MRVHEHTYRYEALQREHNDLQRSYNETTEREARLSRELDDLRAKWPTPPCHRTRTTHIGHKRSSTTAIHGQKMIIIVTIGPKEPYQVRGAAARAQRP